MTSRKEIELEMNDAGPGSRGAHVPPQLSRRTRETNEKSVNLLTHLFPALGSPASFILQSHSGILQFATLSGRACAAANRGDLL